MEIEEFRKPNRVLQPSKEKSFLLDYTDGERQKLAAEILRKAREGGVEELTKEERRYKKWVESQG